ncbi:Glutathione S-transferase [Mycena venus]|uniref:glutathione transferase n=1 Tax=Mycena venus TaxID=2733690 RepID=A0A8H7CTZ8_9AGAR|nr:Glutathione S-transferase [Mycena venus]
MAILKFYGDTLSTSTRRVGTVLYEAKVPFEFIQIDRSKGEHKTPAYLEKHPFGQLPYIDDDGFILFETRAICRYIAAKHPECKLIPTDPKKNALFEQAASIELCDFEFNAGPIVFEAWGKPRRGLTTDQAVIDAKIAALDAKLDAYNAMLSKHKYLAGDEVTLADLFHLPSAPVIERHAKSDIMTRKPHVARWYKDLISRPSWLAFRGRREDHIGVLNDFAEEDESVYF